MGVITKAHLIYGYRLDGERMRKMWHNLSEDEYERLRDDDIDECEIVYGYDAPEFLGIELAFANEDSEPRVLSEAFHVVSQEQKENVKRYAAKAFGEPDISDPEYFLACLCH